MIQRKIQKIVIARHKRNKKICKKLGVSFRKFVRKTKKVLAYRKWSFKKFEKVSFKFATVVFLVAMNVVMFNVPVTNSFYNDIENSIGNIFQASALDINISPENFSDTMLPGNSTTTTIILSKTVPTNLDYQYFASTTLVDTDQTACDYITISASSSPQNISRSLKNFVSATSTETGLVPWDFTFTVADDAPTGTCNFKIIYTAWQTDLSDSSGGFSDVTEMTGSITIDQVTPVVPTAPDVVLNEFLPRPDGVAYGFDFGNDNSDMPKGEWVELYNNESVDVDLTGWYLADSNPGDGNETPIDSAHILVSSPIIPAHGWLVVYMNKAVYNNPGDTVRLFDDNGTQVDSYSYGIDPTFCNMEPTPGDNNTSVSSGSCDGSNVPGNKSFARIPDGTGSWVDPIPTPGEPTKVEETVVEIPVIPNQISSGGGSDNTETLPPFKEEEIVTAIPEVLPEVIVEDSPVVQSEPEVIIESAPEPVIEPNPVLTPEPTQAVEPKPEIIIPEPEPVIDNEPVIN